MSTGLHETRTVGDPRIEEVSPGIFAYIQPDGSWWINNTGCLVGASGVVNLQRGTPTHLPGVKPEGSVLRSAGDPPAGARA